ncbi:glycoside hydrolase family 3 N-terminal domain-containing protein [Radiobacillus sp. PE A8.2]|uniref:glycoside hydrolase family 3 N-terminal domain-containing protein n=1 Tax=Radiobacillus sp. PE A8.2 TaxID=3380349 RepID=UPI00388D155A
MSKKKMSKKKFRIMWGSILGTLLVIAIAANVALNYYSDVITAYFSEIDITSDEAKEARAESTIVAENIADEGIVLLQNEENALPFADGTKVNVFGWSFTNPIYGGTGSGESDASAATSPKQGLEASGIEVNEELYNAYVETGLTRPIVGMNGQDWTIPEPAPEEFYTDERMQQAKEYSDTAVIFIARSGGEGADLPRSLEGPDTFNGEGGTFGASGNRYGFEDDMDLNKHYLELSNREQGMIDAVTENFENVVVVVNSANTFELDWVKDYDQIKSVVNIAGPGLKGFASLGKVLSGEVNPSGRTVDLFATDLLDQPSMTNFGDFSYVLENEDGSYSEAFDQGNVRLTYVDYTEGIYIGYKYYETAASEGAINYEEKVVYPFGYGLSYTTFEQEVVEDSLVWNDTEISVDVNVTNTGSVSGKEVVQLYYSAPYTGSIEKSSIDLAAFEKTDVIEPGQSETVTLTFNVEDMASYDYAGVFSDNGSYVLEAGEYTISLMKNSHEKIADIATKELSEIIYNEEGRSSDLQVAVNQFDEQVTGEGSIDTYLSRANGFENIDVIDNNETFTVTTAEGDTKEVEGRLVEQSFVDFLNSKRYDVPADTHEDAPTTGADNGLTLDEFKGVDVNDESWNELLDQLTVNDMVNLVTHGGYKTAEVVSVGKPATIDLDGPAAISAFISSSNVSGISFPSEVMIGSTWNLELAEQMGAAIGKEAAAYNTTGWYAPAMNIHRSAFAGRNFEYYSEDGVHSGLMAAAVTKAFEDQGGYVYIKHYALNDQETNRTLGVLTWSNEQAIREVYLKPFEIAVKAGGASGVMSAFNSVGNTWAGASSALLVETLRNEWGFTGMVNTDFYMINAYPYMSVELAVRAGNDLLLTGAAPVGVPEVNTDSNDTLWALRDASKNILNTVGNSRAMENGLSTDTPAWVVITIIVDALVVVGIAAGFFFTFRKRKQEEEEQVTV